MFPRRAEATHVLTTANMDESFDIGQRGVFAVGSILAGGSPLFELDTAWSARLKRVGIDYFKASECKRGKRQFRRFVVDPQNITVEEKSRLDAISMEFITLIAEVVGITTQGVGILQDDFFKVINNDAKALSILGRDLIDWHTMSL